MNWQQEYVTMTFENDKKQALSKMDKSRKGSMDKPIEELINIINSRENYYTTSSCSGRIIVFEKTGSKKHQTRWLLNEHRTVSGEEVKDALAKAKKETWFRQEGMILHVASKTRQDAEKLLNIVRSEGWKRSGIISPKKNLLEIQGTEHISSPITSTINEENLNLLIRKANKQLEQNFQKLANLNKRMEQL